jgi:hypothetical protein
MTMVACGVMREEGPLEAITRPILAGGFAIYRPAGPLSGLLGDRIPSLKLASRTKTKLAGLAGDPHLLTERVRTTAKFAHAAVVATQAAYTVKRSP